MGRPCKLTEMQERFVQEYIVDLNGAAAYRRAGGKGKNADDLAAQMLSKPHVQDAVVRAKAERSERTRIKADDVLREVGYLALSDIGEVMDFSGVDLAMRPANEIPEHARRAIASVKVRRYVEGRGEDAKTVELVEFKLHSKTEALKQAAAHVDMATEVKKVIGDPTKPVQVETKHDVSGKLAPYLGVFRQLLDPTGALHPDGTFQPVDTQEALPPPGGAPEP